MAISRFFRLATGCGPICSCIVQPDEEWSRTFRGDPFRRVAGRDRRACAICWRRRFRFPARRCCGRSRSTPRRRKSRAGVALIGDAYSTACPAAGGGLGKALVDVELLLAHLSRWLDRAEGPSASAISQAFNQDPVRVRFAGSSVLRAAMVARSSAVDPGALLAGATLAQLLRHARGLSALRRLIALQKRHQRWIDGYIAIGSVGGKAYVRQEARRSRSTGPPKPLTKPRFRNSASGAGARPRKRRIYASSGGRLSPAE